MFLSCFQHLICFCVCKICVHLFLSIMSMQRCMKSECYFVMWKFFKFFQLSSEKNVKLKPEFLFKGAGKRVQLNPPEGVNVQWAPKGSYRLENMEAMIEQLPTRVKSIVFEQKNWAIYSLDDYSVHLQKEVLFQFIFDLGLVLKLGTNAYYPKFTSTVLL